MKKEIEVWLFKSFEHMEKKDGRGQCSMTVVNSPDDKHTVKAKIVIEIPERRVQISESEFQAAMMDVIGIIQGGNENRGLDLLHSWKEKLFGKGEG